MATSIRRECVAWVLAIASILAGFGLTACQKTEPTDASTDKPKIGFLVKMPEQAWFINEQRAATEAGQRLGFDVAKIGVPDG